MDFILEGYDRILIYQMLFIVGGIESEADNEYQTTTNCADRNQ